MMDVQDCIIRTNVFDVWKLKDNLLFLRPKDNYVIDEDDMKALNEAIGSTFGKTKFFNIVEFGAYNNVTQEARRYAATEESNQYTLADAYIIKSLALKIMGNFYLKVDRPPVPTRLFKDFESALEWLESIEKRSQTLVK